MEQAELEEIIEKARLDRSTVLDLAHNNLASLPENIGNLTNLTKLYLGSNKLTSLPKSMSNLTSLTRLHLRDNNLTNLPEWIGNFHNLNRLDIQYNQLSSLPGWVGNLSALTHISLDNIFLGKPLIAKTFSVLQNLSKLGNVNFGNTVLNQRYLANFNEWKAVWLLDEYNDNIKHFIIEQIGWERIFEDFSNLSNLTELNLQRCRLNSLPKSISNLSNLTRLNIDDNPLIDLSTLKLLSKLEEVYFLDVELPHRYWIKFSEWEPKWLLDEDNAEIRRVLIEQVGYEKICKELNAISLDNWREYTLLKIDGVEAVYDIEDEPIDREPMVLLKMTCPSTQHIHILRVPPEMTSAEAAITWVNHGIHPDKFAVQT